MLKPLTQPQVIAKFGDPRPLIRPDGTISPRWEKQIIGYVELPAPLPLSWDRSIKVTRFKAHRKICGVFEVVMQELYRQPEVWATLGDFGGVYEFRRQRGAKVLSRHAWAIAIDIDVADNPMRKLGKVHPQTVAIFERYGFCWGGRFKGERRDPMHFEYALL